MTLYLVLLLYPFLVCFLTLFVILDFSSWASNVLVLTILHGHQLYYQKEVFISALYCLV